MNVMFTLTFETCNSKNFQIALKIALDLRGNFDEMTD